MLVPPQQPGWAVPLTAEFRRKIPCFGCFCQGSAPPSYVFYPLAASPHPSWLPLHVCHCFPADPVSSVPCSAARRQPARSCSSLLPGTYIIWEHPAFELQVARFGGGHDTPLAFGQAAVDVCAGSPCEVGVQSLQAPSQALFLKRAIASVQGLSTFLKHSSYFLCG